MPDVNEYKRETTRRAMDAMARSRQRDPEYMAKQRAIFDAVLDMMHTSLDGLDIIREECQLPAYDFKQANKLIEWMKSIGPIALQIPFGYGPIKGVPVLVTKVLSEAGVQLPKVSKAVNTAVDVANSTSAIMTPLAWSEKIAQALGSNFAVPLGVKTALSPTLTNVVKQIATWSHAGAGTFSTVLANFAAFGPVFSHGLGALRVYLSYSKLDGVQSVLDHYTTANCDCHARAKEIVDNCQGGSADIVYGALGITAPVPVYHALEKKAHALANKFRSAENRTHRAPYDVAVSLLNGAQAPSGNNRCRPAAGDRSGRCPIAMLTIATLFGDGDPTKGYEAAVAAIQSATAGGVDKLKAKI